MGAFLIGATLATGATPCRADWAYNTSLFFFDPSDSDEYFLGIATADSGRLHLEARYNYENLETASAFAGWRFSTWKVAATPIMGLVFGQTNGVAPGIEAELDWALLFLYAESEYLLDFKTRDENFFYTWFEATLVPADWFRTGLVAQRTWYDSELEVERGVMAEVGAAGWLLAVYWFSPDRRNADLLAFSISLQM